MNLLKQAREQVANLLHHGKNEGVSAIGREKLAYCLKSAHLLELARATARQPMRLVGGLLLLSGAVSCVATHTTHSSGPAAAELGNNNVVTGTVTNSTFKGDGQDKLIIKGSNNILIYHISDSDIASYNTKTVTIIEGSNNNFTSTIRKCVLVYKDRTDTMIIKGNELKIDFRAENIRQLTTTLPASKSSAAVANSPSLASQKSQLVAKKKPQALEAKKSQPLITEKSPPSAVDKPQLLALTAPNDSRFPSVISVDTTDKHLDLSTTESLTQLSGFETLHIKALNKSLPLVAALAYYNQQVQRGDYEAAYQLGELYEGTVYETLLDFPRAIQFYELAARHNHADAAYRLGQLYERGDFEFKQFPADKVRAKYYFNLAAQNGSVDAKEKLRNWQK